MTRKLSRGALVAGIALGGSGFAALPAMAANSVSTPNYYVNAPVVGAASQITPESATLAGVLDTGGDPEALLGIPAGGLSWDGATIAAGTPWADDPSGLAVPLNGIPTSGSNADVAVNVTDSAVNGGKPKYVHVSNAAADNYSTVTFEYDPVSDYQASGNTPGPQTTFAPSVNVPTTTGLSSVSDTIGAFGQAAQSTTGNDPLKPGTQYYYWFVQQPGGTDIATEVNVAAFASATSNPTNVCLPNAAITQDPVLSSYTLTTNITADGATAAAIQGPCVYYYGDADGSENYQTGLGSFTTPALGTLQIGKTAKVSGKSATVTLTNDSAYKAAGAIELDDVDGDPLGTGKFAFKANGTGVVTLKLSAAGVAAAKKHQSGSVKLTSEWDQTSTTKSIKLSAAGTSAKTK